MLKSHSKPGKALNMNYKINIIGFNPINLPRHVKSIKVANANIFF